MKKIRRVLIIEDSTLMSKVIRDTLESRDDIEIAGLANTSSEGWEMFKQKRPDVVTLDINLPDGSGFDILKKIMEERPTPVIVISSITKTNASETIKAYDLGAADVMEKPSDILDPNNKTKLSYMALRIRKTADANVKMLARYAHQKNSSGPVRSVKSVKKSDKIESLIIIASSTGGTTALSKMLPLFDKIQRTGIVVIQHMPPAFTKTFAANLDKKCNFEIIESNLEESITGGKGIVAPGGIHLEIVGKEMTGYYTKFRAGPALHGTKPAADITLKSVPKEMKIPIAVIVLTGMGKDGSEGACFLKKRGALVVIQKPDTCVVSSMPDSVKKICKPDAELEIEKIPGFVQDWLINVRSG